MVLNPQFGEIMGSFIFLGKKIPSLCTKCSIEGFGKKFALEKFFYNFGKPIPKLFL